MDAAPIELIGKEVYDIDHHKVGQVTDLYIEDGSDEPTWLTVAMGRPGARESFVPLAITRLEGDEVEVEVAEDKIKNSPAVTPDDEISSREEDLLYRYYSDIFESQGRGAAGDGTTMIRSEEQLRVDTRTQERGRFHLKKYIVTEEVDTTIPLSREEVRIEREAVTDADMTDLPDDVELSEAEEEIVLHEEVPVVTTETVPKEKIRLEKEQVTKQQPIRGQVRKERVETDDSTEQ